MALIDASDDAATQRPGRVARRRIGRICTIGRDESIELRGIRRGTVCTRGDGLAHRIAPAHEAVRLR
jgi:hypothetical protein